VEVSEGVVITRASLSFSQLQANKKNTIAKIIKKEKRFILLSPNHYPPEKEVNIKNN